MKVELKSWKCRDGFVCVDIDQSAETREKERAWLEVLGDIAGLLAMLGLGLLVFIVF